MAKLDTLTFVGQSGHKYRFKVYSWGHQLKPLPAVYVVTERVVEPDAPPTYSPVFIGITDDLLRVFEKHVKSECFEVYYANTIAVLPVPELGLRSKIVNDLFDALKPPCNSDVPY